MAKNVKEVMKRLPVSRRKKIEARAALLFAEEMTLQEMRKAREGKSKSVKEVRHQALSLGGR
jgi:hypothetical protein